MGCWCFCRCHWTRGEKELQKCWETHPRIPLSRNAPDTGWRWSYTATLVPTRWIFISGSFLRMDLKHSQMDAEIEVAGENEKDSTEDETEVSKCQPFSREHYPFLKYYQYSPLSGLMLPVKNSGIQKQLKQKNELCEKSEICEIGRKDSARYSLTSSRCSRHQTWFDCFSTILIFVYSLNKAT